MNWQPVQRFWHRCNTNSLCPCGNSLVAKFYDWNIFTGYKSILTCFHPVCTTISRLFQKKKNTLVYQLKLIKPFTNSFIWQIRKKWVLRLHAQFFWKSGILFRKGNLPPLWNWFPNSEYLYLIWDEVQIIAPISVYYWIYAYIQGSSINSWKC